MIERELKRLGASPAELLPEMQNWFKVETPDDLYATVGFGGISMSQVAGRLALHLRRNDAPPETTTTTSAPETTHDKTIRVLGTHDVLTQMARCCSPVPGDAIVGYVTRARGVTVHRNDCPNVVHSREKERFVDVEWGERGRMFPVAIKVEAWDRVGLIRDLSTLIAEERVNIQNLGTQPHRDRTVTVSITFETTGVEQLAPPLRPHRGHSGRIQRRTRDGLLRPRNRLNPTRRPPRL